jgi:DNA-binding PadR family transcriptional regulator
MLSKELVAASTVPLVLSVLAKGENYGYALIQEVRELSGGRIEWTEGMLYPCFMDGKQKLIQSEWRRRTANGSGSTTVFETKDGRHYTRRRNSG